MNERLEEYQRVILDELRKGMLADIPKLEIEREVAYDALRCTLLLFVDNVELLLKYPENEYYYARVMRDIENIHNGKGTNL